VPPRPGGPWPGGHLRNFLDTGAQPRSDRAALIPERDVKGSRIEFGLDRHT
jgi:hypothetical protein